MEFCFKYKKKRIKVGVTKCNFFRRGIGLMFSRKKNAGALLFDFGKKTDLALTSYFVFFPFIAIWLDEKNNVLDLKTIRPFKLIIKPEKPFRRIVEIPLNNKYLEQIKLLVGNKKDLKREID